MTNPADQLLAAARQSGIDVFIVPPLPGVTKLGEAWYQYGRHCINLYTLDRTPEWARVLAHEMGHHVLEHTGAWTSLPTWRQEYAAERFALTLLADLYPEDVVYRIEQQAKDYIRPFVQDFLDADIYNHGELDVGIWAGCDGITLDDIFYYN